jgi:hypothetical protein
LRISRIHRKNSKKRFKVNKYKLELKGKDVGHDVAGYKRWEDGDEGGDERDINFRAINRSSFAMMSASKVVLVTGASRGVDIFHPD